MFTTLTAFAAWFAFGHSLTSLILTICENNKNGNYDELYSNSGHYGPKE